MGDFYHFQGHSGSFSSYIMGEWQFLYNKGRILRVDNTKIWLPDIFTFMVDPLNGGFSLKISIIIGHPRIFY